MAPSSACDGSVLDPRQLKSITHRLHAMVQSYTYDCYRAELRHHVPVYIHGIHVTYMYKRGYRVRPMTAKELYIPLGEQEKVPNKISNELYHSIVYMQWFREMAVKKS